MDIPIPDTGDPLDLSLDVRDLPVTGRDGYGEKTPTVRELVEILSALPEEFQDLPVSRYVNDGVSGIDCKLGYESEGRDPDPRMSKYTLHIRLW